MTDRNIRFFQQVPDAVTGDVLDMLTLNNNFSDFGKMKYLEKFGNLDTSRIDLNIAVSPGRTTTSGVEYFMDWETAPLPNTNMWTSGTLISIPSSGVYAVSYRVGFASVGTPTAGVFPGVQFFRVMLIDADGVTPISNLAVRMFNQVGTNIAGSCAGFIFAYSGQYLQARSFQSTGTTQTVSATLEVRRLPISLEGPSI